MTDYINFMLSTAYAIRFFYNGVRQSAYFDDIFIVDDKVTTSELKKIIDRKVELDKDYITDELPYMDRDKIEYKVYKNRFYLNKEFEPVTDNLY